MDHGPPLLLRLGDRRLPRRDLQDLESATPSLVDLPNTFEEPIVDLLEVDRLGPQRTGDQAEMGESPVVPDVPVSDSEDSDALIGAQRVRLLRHRARCGLESRGLR